MAVPSVLTIKKELGTLSVVWTWGKQTGLVKMDLPTKGLMLPKTKEKEPFQTRKQIEQRIGRGGLSDADMADLSAALGTGAGRDRPDSYAC